MPAQPMPIPSISANSASGVVAPGISSIAAPEAARHTAWVGRAPKRATTGISASAPRKAMKL